MAAPARDSLVAALAALRRLTRAAAQSATGSVAIEYGLIASIVSVAIIAGAVALGSTLGSYFETFADYF
jgi:Flp pilus assembly pilin Flp